MLIWFIGSMLIVIAGVTAVGWAAGKGEMGDYEREEFIMSTIMVALLWPAVLGFAIIISPFAGIYFLSKKLASRKAK